MVRLQVQLTAGQHRQVKRRARRLGVSVSEVIRRSVDAELQSDADENAEGRVRRALAAAGRHVGPRGERSTARKHDAALNEAFGR